MFKEVSPPIAYQNLKDTKEAILIDCRTEKEWAIIGVPNLSELNKSLVKIELLREDQSVNPIFVEEVSKYAEANTPVYLICRSGARSASACQMLLNTGFVDVTNVAEGFEGNPDNQGNRATIDGWQFHDLPWQK